MKQRGLRLLLPGFPGNRAWLREARGLPPSRLETSLLSAWEAEEDADPWGMIERWQDYAKALEQAVRCSKNPAAVRAQPTTVPPSQTSGAPSVQGVSVSMSKQS